MVVLSEYVLGQVFVGLRGETCWMHVWDLTAAVETLDDAYISLAQDCSVMIVQKRVPHMKHNSMCSLRTC